MKDQMTLQAGRPNDKSPSFQVWWPWAWRCGSGDIILQIRQMISEDQVTQEPYDVKDRSPQSKSPSCQIW